MFLILFFMSIGLFVVGVGLGISFGVRMYKKTSGNDRQMTRLDFFCGSGFLLCCWLATLLFLTSVTLKFFTIIQ